MALRLQQQPEQEARGENIDSVTSVSSLGVSISTRAPEYIAVLRATPRG